MLAEACEVIDGFALPKHLECGVVGESFTDNIGEDMIELSMFLSRGDVPRCGDIHPSTLLVVFIVGVIISGAWQVMGVVGSATFAASYRWAGVPGVTMVVLVCSTIFVTTHRLATVPGVAAVVVTPPWMELVVPFPRVVVNFSLLPESSDFSGSSGVGEGGGHGELIGELFGVVGTGGESGNLDGEFAAWFGGLLYGGPSIVQCLHLGHSLRSIVHCVV